MNKNNWLWIWFLPFLFIRCESFFEVPRIEVFTFPSHVAADKNISAFCSAKDAKFFWFKDDEMLTNSSNVFIKSEKDYTVIIITAVSALSAGNYTCIAMNTFGMSSQSSILTVITPPKWLIEPLDLVAVIGENVSLECLTEGLPKEITEWKRGNKNETVTETMSFELLNGSIMFNSMKVKDDGTYECTADNMISLSPRKDDFIKEKIPAKFDDKFTKFRVKIGDSVSLPCEAMGDKPLSIIWKRDGKELEKINGERYEIFETLTAKGLKSEFFLREVTKADGQLYTCIIENSYGKDEKDTNLLVMEVPSIPLDLKVQEVLKRGVNLSWSAPYTGNSPITQYIIQYWKNIESHGRNHMVERTIANSQTSALIENLYPGVNYELAIIAENALGRGEPSEILSFTTEEDMPSGAPVDVTVNIKGADSLIVNWKPPLKSERNGQLKGYYVGYKINFDSTHTYSMKKIQYVPGETQEYIITNLRKDTDYSIIIKAFNLAGSGPPSEAVTVRTLVGDLPLALTVSVASTTGNSIQLQWRSTVHEFAITAYVIHYQKKEENWQRVEATKTNENSYNLTGLQSGTFYEIYVSANTDYGEGYPSNVLVAQTTAGDDETAFLAGIIEQKPMIHMAHIIPGTVSVLTAITVSVAAFVWVVKAKSRKNLERNIQEDKRFIFKTAEIQKYDHIDRTRSLSAYHIPDSIHFSTPYTTLLMTDDISDIDPKESPNKEIKTFLSQKSGDKQLLNRVTLKKHQRQ